MSSITLLGDEVLANGPFLDIPEQDLSYELVQLGHQVENQAKKGHTLKKLVKETIPKSKCYVVSIGTADFRGNITTILNVEKFVKGILSDEFKSSFEGYIEKLTKKGKVVFVIAPKPYLGTGSTYKKYKSTIEYIISTWVSYARGVGQKYGITLIDSTSIFNPDSVGLYNKDQTHGSHTMSKVLALLIHDSLPNNGYKRYTKVSKSLIDSYLIHGVNVE